ncbi:MAG: TIGR03663 family protein [Candidatus Aminicenantes bacterium]|nr:TIGR03663 family protein [Candidatus Aminicenantes bacterium]
MRRKTFAYLFVLILAAALFVRLYRLDLRPMHHDEANQAYKFGQLLEKGEYRYDPSDHHGPTLYYFSLPFAWLSGQKTYAELTENTLRGVTVFFGVLILLIFLTAGQNLTFSEKFWAAFFLALSPPLLYFNRFYIQETLFVAFGLAWVICLWKFFQKPDYEEAAWLGISAGLLYATKETSLIVFATSTLALFLVWYLSWAKSRKRGNHKSEHKASQKEALTGIKKAALPLVVAILIFMAISFVFYSSFFRHPQGFLDSFKAISGYSQKALSGGWHHHQFWYYFSLLFYHKGGAHSLVFSEIPFLLLAIIGAVLSFARMSRKNSENFRGYLALFSLATALVYSIIPYKTPWNLLIFYAGFLILAGVGFVYVVELIKIRQARIILAGALLFWTGWQTYLVNYYFHSYPDNPYVYAQTSPDFLRLVARVDELSQVAEEGKNMFIRVIAPPDETWPLPWYLRKFTKVGYWTASEQVATLEPAKIVVMSAAEASKRSEKELESYVSQYYSLRPDVLMALLIRQDLWENYKLRKTSFIH